MLCVSLHYYLISLISVFYFQLKVGPKRKSSSDTKPLAVGDMCLLDLIEFPGELQVAKVMSIEGENVQIQWYQGNRTTKIKPFILVRKGEGRVPWLQTVNRNTIWHHGFTLTKSGLLSTDTRKLIDEFEDY